MSKILTVALLCIGGFSALTQPSQLSGKLYVDVEKGIIQCELSISQLPKMDDFVLVLNKGMNIQYLKADGKTVGYNTDYGLVTLSPFLADGLAYSPMVDTLTGNTVLTIRYSGAFPAYHSSNTSDNNYSDSQVNIAFLDEVLRASYMTKWYPFLYDRTDGRLVSTYVYQLDIVCNKSVSGIYINGCKPAKGHSLQASSSEPQHLSLYIGRYGFSRFEDTYFLNTLLTKAEQQGIHQTIEHIHNFYQKNLNQSADPLLVMAQLFSVGRKNQYADWALAEYPCIMFNLNELPQKLHPQTKTLEDELIYKILAHEIAHEYWGLKLSSTNAYWGFYSESWAEYFALKALEDYFGKEKYLQFVRARYLSEKKFQNSYPLLDRINARVPVNFWYDYYPMLLVGLEQIVGRQKTFAFFEYALNNLNSGKLDYPAFKTAALHSGITPGEWADFERQYIYTNNCLPYLAQALF